MINQSTNPSRGYTMLKNMALVATISILVSIAANYFWKRSDSYKAQQAKQAVKKPVTNNK